MINKHRVENEEWINARKQELEEERHRLELEKVFCKIASFLAFQHNLNWNL